MSDPWKACDLRGIFPTEVSPDLLRRLGAAVGSLLPVGARVIVAGDFRISTPQLKEALIEGLIGSGSLVLDAGQIPTSIAYFAHRQWNTDAVMIVTASHNPSDHNGLKLNIRDLPPTPGDFRQLRIQVEKGHFRQHRGKAEPFDVIPAYRAHVLERWKHLPRPNSIPVVLDAGSGTWSELAPELFGTLGYFVHPLFCKIDGNLPNRLPDCARPNNLAELRKVVLRTRAELGVAWDGDGDCVAFVDSSGSFVTTDEISALMIRELVSREPGATVVYDIKLAQLVRQTVIGCGGVPIMERSGHAFIKRAMVAYKGLFGCEASGHYFFRELGGGDDGLFAALFMAEIVGRSGRSLANLRETLPFFCHPGSAHPVQNSRIPGGRQPLTVRVHEGTRVKYRWHSMGD